MDAQSHGLAQGKVPAPHSQASNGFSSSSVCLCDGEGLADHIGDASESNCVAERDQSAPKS